MNIEEIKECLNKESQENLVDLVIIALSQHASPVFGAAKQIEHEVAALKILKKICYLSNEADEYDYIDKLKVTKAKARNLMYQESLRDSSMNVEQELRNILKSPIIEKDSKGFYLIEVVNPLIMDKLRKRVRDFGFISDGSFSGTLAKIPKKALISLIDSLIDENDKNSVIKKLQEKGYPDASFRGFLNATLSKVGKKVADDTGEEIASTVGEYCGDLFDNLSDKIPSYLKKLEESENDTI